ncbi:hypothetical protein EZV62_011441 [Acer yangbiense]|uniref:Cytochrome P450 n=1 Tax=Acer yangbiense TaxID=1000413 RepID=A0A5C7I584_9ROSI|nr:hypothetical protein EZV62_011441 [Acer yangbiense]
MICFIIRLGIHRALVISSWEVTKECFTTNDSIRPKSLEGKILAYDHHVISFAPYGPYWCNARKVANVELLSNHRLELLKHVHDTEINLFIAELYAQCVENGGLVTVEMKERFRYLAANVIVRMIASKRYFGNDDDDHEEEESRRFQKAVGDFCYQMGLFYISNTVPFLDVMKGYTSKMKKTARELDYVLGNWVDEHRRRRLNCDASDHEEKDFIHVLLSAMDDDKISAHQDANTTINVICLSLILGGSDTTMVTLTWAVSLLLNNRHVLKKAQDELNVHVGSHQQVEESDMKNLVYLQAIVKETLRLYPSAPLSGPHMAVKDYTIARFHIPVFLIRLGIHRTLVISSWEVAKECFTTNDKVFSTRPKFLAVKLMGYDHFMLGFAPYGSYWRDVRKLATVELLSNHRLELLKHVLRMIAGKRYLGNDDTSGDEEESSRFQKALGEFFPLVGLFLVSDTIPFLGWLDVVNGYVSKMKKAARELDYVLGNWVDEHRQRRFNQNISS